MANKTLKAIKANTPKFGRDDFYHSLLKTPWNWIIFYYFIYFFLLNLFFAFLYYLVPNSLSIETPTFLQCFFFSVQTFSTVGYGVIAPLTNYANTIVSIEIVIGLISMSVTTGLIFAKFSKPIAKILFSEKILISNLNGEKVLMFRCANGRSNRIFSANVEVFHLYTETTKEGQEFTRFQPLKLQKSYTPVFGLSWTIMHTIDETSPLFNKTVEEMIQNEFEFIALINGTDDTYASNIQQLHYYFPKDIIFNRYFEDILKSDEDGNYFIEYNKFNSLKD